MTDPYVDPQTIHNPATGASPPAAWGDQVRTDLEFLARLPGCKVASTATGVTASNGVWTTIPWNAPDLRDTDGYHTGTSDQLVVPAGLGGWYLFIGVTTWAANAVGERIVRYTLNGAGDYRLAQNGAAPTLSTRVSFAAEVLLAAGDVVRVQTWQSSGGNLLTGASSEASLRLVALA